MRPVGDGVQCRTFAVEVSGKAVDVGCDVDGKASRWHHEEVFALMAQNWMGHVGILATKWTLLS